MQLPITTKNKSPSMGAKATFNRLRNKIEKLQKKVQQVNEQYERALALYHSDLEPIEKQLEKDITIFILRVMELTKNKNSLNKKEQATLRDLLKSDLDLLLHFTFHNSLHDDLKKLYQELYGESADAQLRNELADLQKLMREHGMEGEIDLDECLSGKSWQEMFAKFGRSLMDKMEENSAFVNAQAASKPKTKKQLLKEEHAKQLETLQSKGINTIYKQLAKELHPDLEADAIKRREKEQLMKQLTAAYEQKDLLTLLSLESEWLGQLDKNMESQNEDTIKIYNSILKDQIAKLEADIDIVSIHPRYYNIQRLIERNPQTPEKSIREATAEAKNLIEQYAVRLEDLASPNPLSQLKKALKYIQAEESDTFDDDVFLNNLLSMLMQSEGPKQKNRKPK